MIFSSNIFLFWFLPITLIGYYLIHKSFRNAFLLIMSLLFYAWGEPVFVLVMIGYILFNYIMALLIDRFRANIPLAKGLLAFGVVGNLSVLFVYKYLDFFLTNINYLGFGFKLPHLVLPIGISFFTFQAMSYMIDVYRGTVAVQRAPQNVGLYVAFFPQLIAGPIVRYSTIEEQIYSREMNFDIFGEGVYRFIVGVAKKVLLANNMALIADKAFATLDPQRSVLYAWVGVLAYGFQILFDFSGYSDMAIGLGKMFGFQFLENFDYPFIARSVSDFWRRWHISLGTWFRDYVYFPLGGSRVKSKTRLVFNLFVVWLLTGVWHGASWNYVLFGLMYFALIATEKLTGWPGKFKSKGARIAYQVFTMLCVQVGWIIFRGTSLNASLKYGLSMLGLTGNPLTCDLLILSFREYWLFLLAAVLCSTPVFKWLRARVEASPSKALRVASHAFTVVFYTFCLVWAVSYLILGAHNPFIYFNF